MKRLIFTTALALCLSALGPVTAPAFAEPVAATHGAKTTLKQTLLRMSARHPAILSQARLVAAALNRSSFQSRRYPDPKFGVYWLNSPYKKDLRFLRDKTPMSGVEFRLMQPIPFPGKLTVDAQIADTEVRIARLRLIMAKNRIALGLLKVVSDVEVLDRTRSLAESYAERMLIVANTARTRYSVGRGDLSALSRAQLRHQAFKDRVIRLQGLLDAELRRGEYYLEGASNRKAVASRKSLLSLATTGELTSHTAALLRQLPRDTDSLGKRSPAIALKREIRQRSSSQRARAKLEYLPDFELFAAYRKRPYIQSDPVAGENFMSAGVTMRIPLWSALSNHKRLAANKNMVRSARAATRSEFARQRSLFQAAHRRYVMLKARLDLHERLLVPTAIRSRDSSRQSYSTGKVDFDAFLNAWEALYALQARQLAIRGQMRKQVFVMAAIFNQILPRPQQRIKRRKQ